MIERGQVVNLTLEPGRPGGPRRVIDGTAVVSVRDGRLIVNGGTMRWDGQSPASAEPVVFEVLDIGQVKEEGR